MIKKILKIISKRKIASGIIAVIIIIGGYFGFKSFSGGANEVRYVLASVEKGTLITSISGSGQVSVLDQADIKSKIDGNVTKVAVENGQEVKKGDILVQIDNIDALKAVRDAEIDLENAKISLSQANTSEQNDESDLSKSYEQSFNSITEAFLDFPNIMSGLRDVLFGIAIDNSHWNIDVYKTYNQQELGNNLYYDSYHATKSSYEKNLADYKATDRYSDRDKIYSLIEETYQTSKDFSESLRNTANLVQSYRDDLIKQNLYVNPVIDTYISNLNTYIGQTNKHIVDLYSAKQTIEENGTADPSSVRSKELSVEQKQGALSDKREKLADYSIRASFDGVIAKINVNLGDPVASTVVATLITKKRIAEISLNEVDVAKVKIGQKANLTFDAVPGLTITGEVAEVDAMGTVSQGVVSYNVKIVFDTQDERVKPGMSVSASIITDVKQDALIIPSSAIKSSGQTQYVETPGEKVTLTAAASAAGIKLTASPNQQEVQTGLSNDSSIEVTSGLKEGDQVIIRTINSKSSSSSSTAPSLLQSVGGNRNTSGGGSFRAVDR